MKNTAKKIGLLLAALLFLVFAGCTACGGEGSGNPEGEVAMAPSGLKKNAKVLFIGDSITDGGRRYDTYTDLTNLSKQFADYMKAKFPDEEIAVYNAGVAGDTVLDLYYRLKEDCYDLQPDYIVLQIGVNDSWSGYAGREAFEKYFRAVLKGIIDNTSAKIILMRPYLLEATPEMQKNSVIVNVNSYIPTVREISEVQQAVADELGVAHFSLFEVTDKAISSGIAPASLAPDAIHPSASLMSMMLDNVMLSLKTKDYTPKFKKLIVVPHDA